MYSDQIEEEEEEEVEEEEEEEEEEATVTGGTPRTVKSKKKNSNVLFLFHWIGDEKGIYIQKIADGSAAAQDGRLQPDDQIIEVL